MRNPLVVKAERGLAVLAEQVKADEIFPVWLEPDAWCISLAVVNAGQEPIYRIRHTVGILAEIKDLGDSKPEIRTFPVTTTAKWLAPGSHENLFSPGIRDALQTMLGKVTVSGTALTEHGSRKAVSEAAEVLLNTTLISSEGVVQLTVSLVNVGDHPAKDLGLRANEMKFGFKVNYIRVTGPDAG